jgi:hypothetical protein
LDNHHLEEIQMRKAIAHLSSGALRKLAVAGAIALVSAAAFAATATYTYDSLGRLSKIVYSSGVVITYTYDAAGNRSTYVVTGAAS